MTSLSIPCVFAINVEKKSKIEIEEIKSEKDINEKKKENRYYHENGRKKEKNMNR
jgi:hypothetical protein